jgi:hypothetical protein
MKSLVYYIFAYIGYAMFNYINKYNHSVVKLSSITYYVSLVVVIIPGPLIFNGVLFKKTPFYYGYSLETYIILVIFAIAFPVSLALGNILGKNSTIGLVNRYKRETYQKLFIFINIAFALFILFLIEEGTFFSIPIVKYIQSQNYMYSYSFRYMENLQFIFKIFNIFSFLFYIQIVFLIMYNGNKALLIYSILCTIFVKTAYLGRDDLIQPLFIIIIMLYHYKDMKSLKRKLFFVFSTGFSILFLMFIFSLFSGNQKSSIKLVDTILDRIVLQSGFVYLQVKELNNVYLGIEGLDLKMFNSLFNHEYKNLSAITYESYYRNDYSGTTAGLSYAQLYYAFGFIGLLVAMLLTTIIGFIDEIFYKSINNNRNNKSFVFAFYVAFISFYYVNIFTNIFSIFSFPQIFSNMIWLIFILFLLMVKLKKGSLCYSYYTY